MEVYIYYACDIYIQVIARMFVLEKKTKKKKTTQKHEPIKMVIIFYDEW